MQSSSTYGADKTLRTEVSAPDPSGLNLMRALVNDRRSDYDARRANRGAERPIATGPVYAAPAPRPQPGSQLGSAPSGASEYDYVPVMDARQGYGAKGWKKVFKGSPADPAFGGSGEQFRDNSAANAEARGIGQQNDAAAWEQSQKEKRARELAAAIEGTSGGRFS